MSFLTRFFQKKHDEDYETILSSLALDIQKRQVQLSEIRLRERRSTLLVTLYTLAAWVAYVSLWYMNLMPNLGGRHRSSKVGKAVEGFPVVVGPIVVLFIRRIVQIWYTSKGDAEEKTLQKLLRRQRSKVEEIKKKTNYYSTRDLLQRYEEGSPSSSPLHRRIVPNPGQPATPQRQPPPPPNSNAIVQTPNAASLKKHPSPTPFPPPFLATPRKQWYDKLADALLGDDEETANAATSRYALICEKCFAHNGLVKESMWEDAQYICPRCNHFNRSIRDKKQGQNLSPTSPTSMASSLPTSPNLLISPASPQHSQQASAVQDVSMENPEHQVTGPNVMDVDS